MKESLFRVFFVLLIIPMFFWLYACTPTAQRLGDTQGAGRLATQAPPSLSQLSVDLPLIESNPVAPAPSLTNAPSKLPQFSQVLVEQLDIMRRDGFPLRINAWLSGYLENTCEGLQDVIAYREQQTFHLELHLSPGKAGCHTRQAFEIIVPLEVDGLASGIYQVTLQQHSVEFEILMDNRDITGLKHIKHE